MQDTALNPPWFRASLFSTEKAKLQFFLLGVIKSAIGNCVRTDKELSNYTLFVNSKS
jgi:hypothetical protein